MKVVIVGTGYVGLVTGTCFAEIGHEVVCLDKDENKIRDLKKGKIPIFEPGLSELVLKNVNYGRLSFTTAAAEAVCSDTDFVYLAVGTPPRKETGHADLSFVYAAAREMGETLAKADAAAAKGKKDEEKAAAAKNPVVFVTKSTVPVGTNREVHNIICEEVPEGRFAIASNPEFMREGCAVDDFLNPDRIVVGSDSEQACRMLEDLYRPLTRKGCPLVVTVTVESAELIKYAANAFLATKITYINEISRLCEKVGADIADVSLGMGLDARIGNMFLNAGPGYGGSCFPKDTLALIKTANDFGSPIEIVETVVRANDRHKHIQVNKIRDAVGGRLAGKRIGVLGLAFKANTDDVRESPALTVVPAMVHEGAEVLAFDPEGARNAARELDDITIVDKAEDVFDKADAVILITEWPEFTMLPWKKLQKKMNTATVVDLRNMLPVDDMKAAGYSYWSIGRLP